MSTLFKKVLLLITITPVALPASAQMLDQYIHVALTGNSSLQQQHFQLGKTMYALKEARSLFLPTVSLQASYIKSAGGRTIDFPTGDLLNNVYSTLNQLTNSNNFPQLENASIQLNPDNFYDAKFRTTLPLINAEIWYNKQIKKQMITQQQATVNVYKRQLIKEVKDAYYRYYQACKEKDIYESALKLVNENIRVNESLYRNGVRNSTALTRAQAEKQKIEADLTASENRSRNARLYFNFLLNRSAEETIVLDSLESGNPVYGDIQNNKDISRREELQQLQTLQQIYTLNKGLQQSHLIPKLNTFLDLGSQAFDWQFNDHSRYYMWGVNLQWDLFASNQNKYRAQQAMADIRSVTSKQEETERALQMQLQQAYNDLHSAVAAYHNAQNQLSYAEKYYTDQLKMYKEGQILYIELIDAQNQLTGARLQLNIAIANTYIAAAEIERCNASYPI